MKRLLTQLLHISLLCLGLSFPSLAQQTPVRSAPVLTGGIPAGAILYDNWPVTVTTNDRRKAAAAQKQGIGTGGQTNFATLGGQWNHNNITYFFSNGTPDIPSDGGRQAVRDAFTMWAFQTVLTFQEVSAASQADIVILWGAGNHGDGVSFDGPNGVLAHTWSPPPVVTSSLAGDVHFDEDETWTTAAQSFGFQPIDLVTVAAHEIGHALGLDHSTTAGAIMQAFYNGSQRCLGADDIAGIQSIYSPIYTSISGANGLCSGSTTYSVAKLPAYTNVSWSSSNTGVATISSAGVLTAVGSGIITITATLTTACGTTTITKQVNVNAPIQYPSVTQYDQQGDNCYNVAHFSIDNYDPSLTYTFTRGYHNPTIIRNVNTGSFIVKVSGTNTTATFAVTATSSCGGSVTTDYIEAVYQCDEISSYRAAPASVAYPNPAAESLVLPADVKTATLLNEQGKPVQQVSESGRMDVQSLPEGLYNLQMWQDGKLINQRIQVKH